MRLMDLLRDELIKVELTAHTRDDALHELVTVLVEAGELPESARPDVLGAILAREKSHTTGLGHGVAVPHGLTDATSDVLAVLGISRGGIDFSSVDGAPSRIVILLVVPKNRFQSHVRTLAGIARLLNDAALRERLVLAPTAEMVMDIIVAKEEAGV